MIQLRFDKAAALVNGTLYNSYHAGQTFTGVSIDSRTLREGELFFAIRGERLDGHSYLPGAIKAGAGGVVSQFDFTGLEQLPGTVPVIAVHDSHRALIDLAKAYRRQIDCRCIAITGSNGKTTTKELAARLFEAVEPQTYGSAGNLNNLYGLPLALLRMPQDTKIAVLETGISQPGEMSKLAAILEPDMVVLTNIGRSHLQFLKSVDDVAREKLQLLDHAPQDAPVIFNADDPILMKHLKSSSRPLVTFGMEHGDIRPDEIRPSGFGGSDVTIDGHTFCLPLPGRHQVYNLLAAYAIVQTAGYEFAGINTAAVGLGTAPMRGETIIAGGVTFVADCYNANPESMLAGLKTFFEIDAEQPRILILGDMLELGSEAATMHREVGAALAGRTFDRALLVGRYADSIVTGALTASVPKAKFRCYQTVGDLLSSDALPQDGELVFVKGSRGVALEKVIERYQSNGGGD